MNDSPLDSAETYSRLDPSGLRDRIAGLPEQMEQAWVAAMKLALPPDYAGVARVAVLGMGGSGIGGTLMQALGVATGSKTPVTVVRGYGVAAYMGPDTLAIASSNSGNTEETVAALGGAIDLGAKCVVITTGGRLAAIAEEHKLPVLRFAWDAEPRSALGWSFAAPLAICSKLGVVDASRDVDGALAAMRTLRSEIGVEAPASRNPAKQLAARLAGNLPIIVGAEALAPVAYRWRTQINENGKCWAVAEELPEMNHNAPVGYGLPAALVPLLRVVLLRQASMHPRVERRVALTHEQLEAAGVAAEVLDVPGSTALEQMLWAVPFGDFVSYYVGLLNGVDPSPVKALDWLKAQMSAG